ncbi:hypothetical protein Taro_029808 [Colocasia esculenta]|uniref:AMP-binding enzyme C-terminal domain-containing protein n=1 Tax=Colocasia esculenta TaxID=4460 RepID=A0A843VW04_COLES|nr:hypothetical protein [Colocasia esculenta]
MDDEATSNAFRDVWFFTGDVGVMHPDGYIQINDRSKDIIISGGENISSVVAMPHPRWGETPCAFVTLTQGIDKKSIGERDIIAHYRKNLFHFMARKKVVFEQELPKTNNKI